MSALHAAAPSDPAALAALLGRSPGRVRYVAGGTDLLIRDGTLPESGLLVDISRTRGLAFVETEGESLRIGAATTVAALASHPGLRRRLAALSEAAEQCGSVQIRNRATIGGNIATASPAGDLLPVLACAGARLTVLDIRGSGREVPFAGFVPAPGEMIREIAIPAAALLPRSAFVKLGPRSELTISRLNLAMQAEYSARGRRIGEVRLFAGALGPVPRRLPQVEESLRHRALSPDTLRGFLRELRGAVDTAIPGRNSQRYKRRAVMGLGLDLIARIAGLDARDPLFDRALA